MRALHQQGAAFGDQYRQQDQQGTVDSHRRKVLAPQQHQADLGDQPADDRQGPVQQQGDGGHADEVIGHAGVEVTPHQPEQEQREHRAEQQVLAPAVAEQFDPGRALSPRATPARKATTPR